MRRPWVDDNLLNQMLKLRFPVTGSMLSVRSIAQILKLSYRAVQYNLKSNKLRYRQHLEQNPNHPFKRPRRRLVIAQSIINRLLSSELLQEWSHLSLRRRAQLIRSEFSVSISASSLRVLYQQNGISYRKTQIVFDRALNARLTQTRIDFARRLASLLQSEEPVIYIDESQF